LAVDLLHQRPDRGDGDRAERTARPRIARPLRRRQDYLGAAAVVVFLSCITFAFIEAPALGWSTPAVLTMALLGVIGLAVFLTRERHAASPMLPLSIFAQRQFAAVNAVSFIVYPAPCYRVDQDSLPLGSGPACS
jgi:hypothetical protein